MPEEIDRLVPPPLNDKDFVEKLLVNQDGPSQLLKILREKLPAATLMTPAESISKNCQVWNHFGNLLRDRRKIYEALDVFHGLYEQILSSQNIQDKRLHKGLALFQVSHCCRLLGWEVYCKRYMMLALCEDAISGKGTLDLKNTGTYGYLATVHGISSDQIHAHVRKAFELFKSNRKAGRMPEWILQHLDQYWKTETSSPHESGIYRVSRTYCEYLLGQIKDKSGKTLELLADYLMGSIPGCRTYRRARTDSTDYDVVVSVEGQIADFRSELGRYFVCEAKSRSNQRVSFSEIAKFCRVLDSVKAKFGVVFTTIGHSGEGDTKNADREILKVFQDRGIVIVVITDKDMKHVAHGANLITLLREKYEVVRLDLRKDYGGGRRRRNARSQVGHTEKWER